MCADLCDLRDGDHAKANYPLTSAVILITGEGKGPHCRSGVARRLAGTDRFASFPGFHVVSPDGGGGAIVFWVVASTLHGTWNILNYHLMKAPSSAGTRLFFQCIQQF
jgi:hypothetical protein